MGNIFNSENHFSTENTLKVDYVSCSPNDLTNLKDGDIIDNFPSIYFFFNTKNKITSGYIGEGNALKRLFSHRRTDKLSEDDKVIIFYSKQFNKSTVYEHEGLMIKVIDSLDDISLKNIKLSADLSKDYHMKNLYKPLLKEYWNILKKEGMVNSSDSFDEVISSMNIEFTPNHLLQNDQFSVGSKIIEKFYDIETEEKIASDAGNKIMLTGFPGTGKTSLLLQLFDRLSKKYKVLFLAKDELTKEIKNTMNAKVNYYNTGSKVDSLRSIRKIKKDEFDIIIADEAHRIRRIDGFKGMGSIMKDLEGDSEFAVLNNLCKNIIVCHDKHQRIHPNDFVLNDDNYEIYDLREQLRGNGSNFVEWIVADLDGEHVDFKKSDDFKISIYNSFDKLYSDAKSTNTNGDKVRILSGYDVPWKSSKSADLNDFEIDGINLKWNKMLGRAWNNSVGARNLTEVAYFDTIQGYDVNLPAIIVGNDLFINAEGKLDVNLDIAKSIKSFVHNGEKYNIGTASNLMPNIAFIKANNPGAPKSQIQKMYDEDLKSLILNRYKVLFSRGKEGVMLYFRNKDVKNYFATKLGVTPV